MSPTALAAPEVNGSQNNHAQQPPGTEISAAHDVKAPSGGFPDQLVNISGASPLGSLANWPMPRQEDAIGGQALDGRSLGLQASDNAPQARADGAHAPDIGQAARLIQNLEEIGPPKLPKFLKFAADELDRVCRDTSRLLRLTKFISTTLVTITITLNALIIGGRTLGLQHRILALFAVVNTVIKGTEMHFQIDHVHQTLRKGVGKLKVLDTQVHGMIHSQYDPQSDGGKQLHDFKKMYDSAMELVAEHISPRGARDMTPLLDDNGGCCARLCCRRGKSNSKIIDYDARYDPMTR